MSEVVKRLKELCEKEGVKLTIEDNIFIIEVNGFNISGELNAVDISRIETDIKIIKSTKEKLKITH